jgi:hypothetical protein
MYDCVCMLTQFHFFLMINYGRCLVSYCMELLSLSLSAYSAYIAFGWPVCWHANEVKGLQSISRPIRFIIYMMMIDKTGVLRYRQGRRDHGGWFYLFVAIVLLSVSLNDSQPWRVKQFVDWSYTTNDGIVYKVWSSDGKSAVSSFQGLSRTFRSICIWRFVKLSLLIIC